MSPDAPESTTEVLHSGFEDGDGKHQSSDGEKGVAFVFLFELVNAFCQVPRLSGSASHLSQCLFLRPHSQILEHETALMTTGLNHTQRWNF